MQPLRPTHRITFVLKPEGCQQFIQHMVFVVANDDSTVDAMTNDMVVSGTLVGINGTFVLLDIKVMGFEVTSLESESWLKAHIGVLEQVVTQNRAQQIASSAGPRIMPAFAGPRQ